MHAEGKLFVDQSTCSSDGGGSFNRPKSGTALQDFVTAVVVNEAVKGSAVSQQGEGNSAFGYPDGIVVCSVYRVKQPAKLRFQGNGFRRFGRFFRAVIVIRKRSLQG